MGCFKTTATLNQPTSTDRKFWLLRLHSTNVNSPTVLIMAELVKSGYLQKHSKSFLSGGWDSIWVKLYMDSNIYFYKKKDDSSHKARVILKDVSKWFAVGRYTEGLPDRPDLPKSANIENMIAIPQKPSSKAKIHWLLCGSEAEFNEWMSAIISTLPPMPQRSNSASNIAQPVVQHMAPVNHGPNATAPYPQASHPYPGGSGQPQPIGFAPMPVPQHHPYPQPGQQPYPPSPYPPQQHSSYPPQPYPTQPYSQAYPQQPYPQAYPQRYPQPYPAACYPQQQYMQPGYAAQPSTSYVNGPQHGKSGGGKGNMLAGLAGGALLGYGASRMMGGGGFGLGRFGSWSSMSSIGSYGSGGSYGSWD